MDSIVLTEEDLGYLESNLHMNDDTLLSICANRNRPNLVVLQYLYYNVPPGLLDLYTYLFNVWIRIKKDPTLSWVLLPTAVPTLIMGNWMQHLSHKRNAKRRCITFGNNASKSSFEDGRLPENILAAKRIGMHDGFSRFDIVLSLLASNCYFFRKPQTNWFAPLQKVAEGAQFCYEENAIHCDIHAFAYFVELGKLQSPPWQTILDAFQNCKLRPPNRMNLSFHQEQSAFIRKELEAKAPQMYRRLLDIFQPTHVIASWGDTVYLPIFSSFSVVEGPSTLTCRVVYKNGQTLSSIVNDSNISTAEFFSNNKNQLVALMTPEDPTVVLPEDEAATLFNFRFLVTEHSWGYCSILLDPLLNRGPFSSACSYSRIKVGEIWSSKTQALFQGPLLPKMNRATATGLSAPSNFKKVESIKINAFKKKKRARRKSIHLAILREKGVQINE